MATQTQEVTQRLAPFQEKFLEDIFAQASALKGTGMPYAPQQLADCRHEQQQAMSQATAGVGAYQPYLQAAQQYAAPGGVHSSLTLMRIKLSIRLCKTLVALVRCSNSSLAHRPIGQGAFGGSRAAVAGAELGRATMEQQGRTAAQLRQQGYAQAQQAAQNAAQLQAGLGAQAQQMGVQDINTLLGIGGLTQQNGTAGTGCSSSKLTCSAVNALSGDWLLV